MKLIPTLPLLGACALLVASCEKPKIAVAPPPPPPGADGKFSDPGAGDFLKQYEAYAEKTRTALKDGNTAKFQILNAEGTAFSINARNMMGRLKEDELPQFQARVAEYEKAHADVKRLLPNAAKKIEEARALSAARKAAAEAAKNNPPPVVPPPAEVTPPVPAPTPAPPTEPAPAPAPAAEPAPATPAPPAAPTPPSQ